MRNKSISWLPILGPTGAYYLQGLYYELKTWGFISKVSASASIVSCWWRWPPVHCAFSTCQIGWGRFFGSGARWFVFWLCCQLFSSVVWPWQSWLCYQEIVYRAFNSPIVVRNYFQQVFVAWFATLVPSFGY